MIDIEDQEKTLEASNLIGQSHIVTEIDKVGSRM